MHGLVQVAGVQDLDEAIMLAEQGVDWIGLPLRLPVHRDNVTEAQAAQIVQSLGSDHPCVLITYMLDASSILDFCRSLDVCHVQLHGDVPASEVGRLRAVDPLLHISKSLVVRDDNLRELLTTIDSMSAYVDMFITDTFDPRTGASGGNGITHDWDVSRALVSASPRPVMLAGGLTAANVGAAIRAVGPAAVDVHTGVEDQRGRKDRSQVRAFVHAARSGFAVTKRAGRE